MKEILLTFKTKLGRTAYSKVESEGKTQSFMDRKIARSVAKDEVVRKNPLVVRIKIKIKRLAIQINLPEQVEKGLKKFGAEKDKDYSIEVLW